MSSKGQVKTVFIGLGSNLEKPLVQIKQALLALSQLPQTHLLRDSGYYSSKPMGPQDQPDYINAVAWLETSLESVDLLDHLQAIEQQQGRVRKQHWGARTIDLDILLYGDEIINLPRLTVPHPGICERDFVYLPLLKLVPGIRVPGCGALQKHIDLLPATATDQATDYGTRYRGIL